MKKLLLHCAAAGVILFHQSCHKNTDESNLACTVITANHTNQLHRVSASGLIEWTNASARVRKVELAAKQNESKVSYESTDGRYIDMRASPGNRFGYFTMPLGAYQEVALKISLTKSEIDPALFLHGYFTIDTLEIPVFFSVYRDLVLKSEANNLSLNAGDDFVAVTTLDLSHLMLGIDQSLLRSASLTNGTMVISDTSNTAIYNKMLANMDATFDCDFRTKE